MQEESSVKKLFFGIDFLSYKQSLCFNGNSNYSTILGAILSFFIIVLAIAFSIYNLILYLDEPNKYISENIVNNSEQSFTTDDILLMFKYSALQKTDSSKSLSVENYFSTKLELLKKSGSTESTLNLGFKSCEKKDFSEDYYNYLQSINLKTEDYFCIKKSYSSQVINLSYKENDYEQLHFVLTPCEYGDERNNFFNNTSAKCLYDYTKAESILNEYDLKIKVLVPYDYCDHENSKNPIKKKHREYTYTYVKGGFNLITQQITKFKYESNNGVIFNSIKKSEGYTSYESLNFYQNPQESITTNTYIFNIYVGSSTLPTKKYIRYYFKLQSYIADVGGVLSFVTRILTIFTFFLTEGIYFRDLALVPFEKGYFNERKNKIRCIRQKLGYEKVSASLYKHDGQPCQNGLFEMSEIQEKEVQKVKNKNENESKKGEDESSSKYKIMEKDIKEKKDDIKRDKYLKANFDLISRINFCSSLGNLLFPCLTRDKKLNLLRSFKKFACYYLSADELVHNFMKYEKLSGVTLVKST